MARRRRRRGGRSAAHALAAGRRSADRQPGGHDSGRWPERPALSRHPACLPGAVHRRRATCPGLPWAVLAGIGEVESDHGQSTRAGVHSGANYAGAEGPMQFEPATFAQYAVNA